jgi:hypothetical protein
MHHQYITYHINEFHPTCHLKTSPMTHFFSFFCLSYGCYKLGRDEYNKVFLCAKISIIKGVITFCPMNYSALTFFLHELPIITLDPIKLSFYDTLPPFVCQRDGQRRENFFFHFYPHFRRVKVCFSDLK